MRRLKGLKSAAIIRVETTTRSCGCFSWPVSAWKIACVAVTLPKEHYPETALLRQVEGVGPLTALAFVLTLEDPYRFEKSRSVGAYLGLVPASDRSRPQKRISKEGDEMLSVSSW